jgi:hypothetical protein
MPHISSAHLHHLAHLHWSEFTIDSFRSATDTFYSTSTMPSSSPPPLTAPHPFPTYLHAPSLPLSASLSSQFVPPMASTTPHVSQCASIISLISTGLNSPSAASDLPLIPSTAPLQCLAHLHHLSWCLTHFQCTSTHLHPLHTSAFIAPFDVRHVKWQAIDMAINQ